MKYLVHIILLFSSINLFSQKEYQITKASGIIPDEIIKMNKSIYNSSIDTVQGKNSEKKDKLEFLLQSNYELGNLLKSGQILFGDKFTNYVTKVGQNLIKDDPKLLKNIKFYVVKSPEVNAYSTQQGYLFVNIGLLAQIENEAQLALILSHELIHYTEKHNIESFLKGKKIIRKKGEYKNLTSSDQQGLFLKYSKEHEMEADQKGFENFYLKAHYDVNEALNTFDVLLYSYLPVDEIEFDTTFFDDKYFKIQEKYFLNSNETKAITAIEDYNDKDHTHPNIKKRRTAFIDYIAEHDIPKGKVYLFGEDEFKKIQKDARYELSSLHAGNLNYCASIYNSYILLKKDSNDLFLKRNIAYSLYAMSKYKTYKSVRDVLPSATKIEGKSQQVYKIFNSIKRKDLNILALKYNWNLYHKTTDKQFERQYKDLLKDMVYKNDLSFNSFKKQTTDSINIFTELSKEAYDKLSKYGKIRYDKKKALANGEGTKEYKLDLADLLTDSLFYEEFRLLSKKARNEKENEEKKEKKEKKHMKTINKPIDKLLVSNPFFLKFNAADKTKYIDSEERELEYIKMIEEMAQKTDLDIDILDIYNITKNDIDKFNQISILNSWVDEFIKHQDYDKLWDIYGSQDIYLKNVLDNYNKQYFSISGIYSKESNPKALLQYFFTIDGYTGKIILSNYSSVSSIDYNAPIKSFLYDSFINLKRKY